MLKKKINLRQNWHLLQSKDNYLYVQEKRGGSTYLNCRLITNQEAIFRLCSMFFLLFLEKSTFSLPCVCRARAGRAHVWGAHRTPTWRRPSKQGPPPEGQGSGVPKMPFQSCWKVNFGGCGVSIAFPPWWGETGPAALTKAVKKST